MSIKLRVGMWTTLWLLSGMAAASEDVILELHPARNPVYLHEAVPLIVTLLAAVPLRNIQYPRIAGEGFRIAEFPPPAQSSVSRDGRLYSAQVFSTSLVPLRSGNLDLGPAQLDFELRVPASGSAAFFGGSEMRAEMQHSQIVGISVLPLPKRGRPADFSGTVGRFTISLQARPATVEVGDPITVVTRISGVGNIYTLSCATFALPGTRAYPPRARRSGANLECEQAIIPERAGTLEIPGAHISYFDPVLARYQTPVTQPIRIRVTPPVTPVDRGVPMSAVPLVPEQGTKLPWLLAATLALLALGWHVARRRAGHRNAAAFPPRAPRIDWLALAESALAGNDGPAFHDAVFRALRSDLELRHGLPAATLTEAEVAQALLAQGLPGDRLASITRLFQDCSRVRYARAEVSAGEMQTTLKRLRGVIESD